MAGPAAVKVEGSQLEDPVVLAYDNLNKVLELLNEVKGPLNEVNGKGTHYTQMHGLVSSVLDQLIGWDCCAEQRLIAPTPGQAVPYRDDLTTR